MFAGKDATRAALLDKVAAGAKNGISDEFRTSEVARLRSEIAALETQIETIHRESERAGIIIPRRVDADPAALLAPDGEGGDA